MALRDVHPPRHLFDPGVQHAGPGWSGLAGANEHLLWLDPLALAEQAAEVVFPRAREAGIALILDPIGAPAPVACEQEHAVRLLVGLLERAVLLTPRGAEIVVTVQDRADEVLFAIEDAGPGLTTETLTRLFGERGVTESGVPAAGSRALELARDAASAQGGRLWAASAPGVGTTVFFTLPRQRS
jgi:signal transduction histidine kinase